MVMRRCEKLVSISREEGGEEEGEAGERRKQ